LSHSRITVRLPHGVYQTTVVWVAATADVATTIQRLRTAGFDDRAIHDVCAIAAYYGFVNRIADGLGVELEPRFPP
jgi:alkylhydroperoxidase family enzyme